MVRSSLFRLHLADGRQAQTGREHEAAAQGARLVEEALADAAGLDRTYISGVERVTKNPTVTVVERVATALDCRLGELLD